MRKGRISTVKQRKKSHGSKEVKKHRCFRGRCKQREGQVGKTKEERWRENPLWHLVLCPLICCSVHCYLLFSLRVRESGLCPAGRVEHLSIISSNLLRHLFPEGPDRETGTDQVTVRLGLIR